MQLSQTAQNTSSFSGLLAQTLDSDGIRRMLKTVRTHLGMDVAFISRFREMDRALDYVDADEQCPIQAGLAISQHEGYCLRVVRGELPQLIPDTARVPAALAIPETLSLPIGCHLSVPITMDDGSVYGTLCCFGHKADPSLGERDLKMLQAFAEVLANRIGEIHAANDENAAAAREIRTAFEKGAPNIVYQPLYSMDSGKVVSLECLSRFNFAPYRSPDKWFAMASKVGMGSELELKAIHKAVSTLHNFPDAVSLAVNASPEFVLSGRLLGLLADADLKRLTLELTEHETVADYESLDSALQPLRSKGMRLAIDDAGAGYASMRHILSLHPDSIKLDMSLTRNIDKDPSRRALAKALIGFAGEIGSRVTAEGVETEGELKMLRGLGVHNVQGYYLGRPVPLETLVPASHIATSVPDAMWPGAFSPTMA